jgi:hypothetical protein
MVESQCLLDLPCHPKLLDLVALDAPGANSVVPRIAPELPKSADWNCDSGAAGHQALTFRAVSFGRTIEDGWALGQPIAAGY